MDPQVEWRTGDIILFSGSGINSLVIRLFTNSVWSHVGVVCWIELLYHNGKREVELFSFELGSKAYEDLMTGQDAQLKVRLVRLQTILKMYDMVAIRKLKLPSRTPKQSRAWSKKFQKYAWKMRGVVGDIDKIFDLYWNTENCQCCGIHLEGLGTNKKCLDHCHKTGEFRKIVCHMCNKNELSNKLYN